MDENIGDLIKNLRVNQRFTLKDISERTGLSISFLSQVERAKSSITLQSLSRISEALGVSRSYFFNNLITNPNSITHGNDNELHFRKSNFVYQGLAGDIANPFFEPMLVILLPNNLEFSPSTHTGQEFVYVLSGELTVIIGEQESKLQKGDSFHLDSTQPHTWFNRTTESVKLLYVYANGSNGFIKSNYD